MPQTRKTTSAIDWIIEKKMNWTSSLSLWLGILLTVAPHASLAFVPQRLQRTMALCSIEVTVQPLLPVPDRRHPFSRLAAQEDDEEDEEDEDEEDMDALEPLAEGIDSVSWLPTVKGAPSASTSDVTIPGAELIPLFPLGGIVYTPNSQHVLNIFEPRYREMYSDILMNGTKRFAVAMSHPTEAGRFAEMAVLFELEDLKEVSERTADQIKYICNHRVTGRVKLHRILNPQDWESRKTYLRAEGTVIDDSGKDLATMTSSITEIENPTEQKLLRSSFAKLVELQHELEEDVRFTRASVLTLAVKPGSGSDGLWQTIKLWQSFADQRLMSRQNELQQDFQEKLQDYLKKDKGLKGELPR